MPHPISLQDDSSPTRVWGARLFGLGALGLILTCVCYVLAGPVAALPGGASNLADAIQATQANIRWMRAAGLSGMVFDVFLTVGAALLAAAEFRRGIAPAMAGWLAVAVACALFILIDAIVALALPAAAQRGAEVAYPALRALFDGLFAIGAAAAGGGALAATWAGSLLDGRALPRWMMRLAGLIALGGGAAHFLGFPAPQPMGLGITLLAVGGVITALSLGRWGAEEVPPWSGRLAAGGG